MKSRCLLLSKFYQEWRQLWRGRSDDQRLLQRVGKNLSLGTVGACSVAICGLGRTAVLMHALPIADVGRVFLVVNVFSVATLVLDIRLNDVLYRYLPAWRGQDDRAAVRALLLAALSVSSCVGLLVGGGIALTAPLLSERVYGDPSLASMLRAYAPAGTLLAFSGFYTPILRLNDTFGKLIFPKVFGAAVSLVGLAAYLLLLEGRSTEVIVSLIGTGVAIESALPLIVALRLAMPDARQREGHEKALTALRRHAGPLRSMLYSTNCAGYLKLGSEAGGTFLLGVLASPVEVALFGVARQFSRPLQLLQTNVQAAMMPEVFLLVAADGTRQLYRLTKRFVVISTVGGALLSSLAIVVATFGLLVVGGQDYAEGVLVVWVLMATWYVTFIGLLFYPLAVATDRLSKRNAYVSIRFVYIAIAAVGGLNALTLAVAQCAGAVTTRLGCDLSLFLDLRRAATKRSVVLETNLR